MDISRRLRLPAKLLLSLTIAATLSSCGESEPTTGDSNRHLSTAQSYFSQHQYRTALIEVRNALRAAPSAEAAELYAELFIEIGQPKTASEFIESFGAKSLQLSALLTRAYLDQGKYISASKTLNKFNAETLPNHQFELLSAETSAGLADYDKAKQLLNTVISASPNNEQARILQLQIASIQNDAITAQEAINSLKQNHSESPRSLVVLARAASAAENYSEAEQYLMLALRFIPDADIMVPAKASTLLLLIETLTNQGRYADAVPYSNAIAKSNPNWQETQDRMQNAISNLQSGDLAAAEKILLQIQQDNPNQEQSAALLGIINLQRGEAEKAAEYFDNNIDPETASPIFTGAAALAQLQQNQIESALDMLTKALEVNPDNQRLLILYGLTATRTTDLFQAGIDALLKATAQSPDDIKLHTTLADGYFNGKDYASGKQALAKAISLEPDNLGLRYHVAKRYFALGLTDDAKQYAKELLKNDSGDAHNWIISGLVASLANKQDDALAAFDKALNIDPSLYTANLYRALLSANTQKWAEASRYFKKAIDIQPNQIAPYGGLLKSLAATHTPQQVVAEMNKVATSSEKKTIVSLLVADYLIQLKDLESANKTFSHVDLAALKEESSQKSKIAEEVFVNLTKLKVQKFASLNQNSDAKQTIESAITQFPQNHNLLGFAAAYYLNNDDLASAAAKSSLLRKLGGESLATLIEADILLKQDQGSKALTLLYTQWSKQPEKDIAVAIQKTAHKLSQPLGADFLDEWEKRFPNAVQPIFYRANQAQKAGDIDTAITYYERILKIDANSIAALNNLAWYYQEQNKMEQANGLADRAVKLAPNSAAVLDTAGYIKLRMNDKEALALLERAVTLDPESEEIAAHYQKAKATFN